MKCLNCFYLFLICLICSFHISPFQSISHVSPLEVLLVFVERRRQVYTRRCPASKEKTSLGRTDWRSPETILAKDMEHDTNDIVYNWYDISIFGITSIYLHTFSVSTLFSHYVFVFVSNWLCGFYKHNSDVSVSHVHITSRAKFLVKLHEPFLEWVQGFLSNPQCPKGRSWDDIEWKFNSFNGKWIF